MALLFLDSFDHYQTAHLLSKWTSSVSTVTISSGNGRCDTNCLQLSGSARVIKGLLFGSARGTVGFALNIDPTSLTHITLDILYLGNNTADHLFLRWNPDGSLEMRRVESSEGVLLGTSAPGLVQFDHWYYVEVQALIDPAAGEVIVRLNNAVVLSVSGIDTTTSVFSPDPVLRQVSFRCSNNQGYYVDDLYMLDSTGAAPQNTFLGDCRVEYLRPNAAGSSQQWAVTGAATHYGAVDDIATPDDDTTYVESTTVSHIDTNQYQPTGLPSGAIFGAQLGLYAKKSEIGPRVIAPVVNTVVGSSHDPSHETYQYWLSLYPLNPTTGLAWTIAEINAAEFGVKVVS